jgi:TRAP-type C4-dicarboxylate transport system substrate-binding protein
MKTRSLVAGLLAALAVNCISPSDGHSAPVTLRFSSGAPENHFLTKQYIEWANLIEKNSKGEIKVQVYHSAQLFRDNEVIKAVQTEALESGCGFTMYIENQLVPAIKVYMMPFLFQSLDETWKVYQSGLGDSWKKTAEKKGVKLLAMVVMPSPEDQIVMTTKPAKVPADLSGQVIRGASPEHALAIKKWGAGPSFLTGAEVYLGLQRNTINGAINSIATYIDRKLYEVAPYVVQVPISVVHTFIIMNKSVFDGLTPEQQKTILEASAAVENNTLQIGKTTLKEGVAEAQKKAKVYAPTSAELALWKEGMPALWDEIAKDKPEVVEALTTVKGMLQR